jgi:hypothetical protein
MTTIRAKSLTTFSVGPDGANIAIGVADEEGQAGALTLSTDCLRELMMRLCHGNSIEQPLRAKARQGSCRCDRMLPLCGSFGPEDPQCGSGDEMTLKVEGVVDRTVHAEETLGGSG